MKTTLCKALIGMFMLTLLGCDVPPSAVATATAFARQRITPQMTVTGQPETRTAQPSQPVAKPTSTLINTPTRPPAQPPTQPPAAAATATVLLAAPVLESPGDGSGVGDATITFRWRWVRSLAADEYYDLRVWREGQPHHGIAWAKDTVLTAGALGAGRYWWAVAVIRHTGTRADGTKEWVPVSQESLSWSFSYSPPSGQPTATPAVTRTPLVTPVPPTVPPTPTISYP